MAHATVVPASNPASWHRAAVGAALLAWLGLVAVAGPIVAAITIVAAVAAAVVWRPQWGLVVLGVLTCGHLSIVATDYFGVPAVLAPALGIVGISLVVHRLSGESFTLPGRAVLVLGFYGLVSLTGLMFATDVGRGWEAIVEYVKMALLAAAVIVLLRRSADLVRLAWAVLLTGAGLASVTVVQAVTGSFENEYSGLARVKLEQVVGSVVTAHRAMGPLDDPNFYGQLLVALVPLAMVLMMRTGRRLGRVAAAGALVVLVAGTLLTYSRGAFLGLLLVGGATLVYLRPPRTVVAGLAVVLVALGMVGTSALSARVSTVAELLPGGGGISDESFQGRTGIVLAGAQMFMDHPVTGVGPGNYPVHYQDYSRKLGLDSTRELRQPHNLYLEVAAETGAVGLLAFGAVVIGALGGFRHGYRAFAAAGRDFEAALTLALGIGLGGYLVTYLFLHGDYWRFFWVLLAIGLALPALVGREMAAAR